MLTVDRYWSLFLGRPTAIKNSDLEMTTLTNSFAMLGRSQPARAQTPERIIIESLERLMEIGGNIADSNSHRTGTANQSTYMAMSIMDKEMKLWRQNLPSSLKWNASTVNSAPRSFFLLQ